MRVLLFWLPVAVLTFALSFWQTRIAIGNGLSFLDLFSWPTFLVLSFWLSFSFVTQMAGWLRMLRLGWQSEAADPTQPPAPHSPGAAGRTALIMPVYNEGTRRIFAGIAAMRDDMARSGHADAFDIYILSDSTKPDAWLAEIAAWRQERGRLPGAPALYYRRRIKNDRKKIGNIEHWLEHHGGAYTFMIVLDADSIMTADSILALEERIARRPDVALVQSPPRLARGRTVFARMLQFAGMVMGSICAHGIAAWSGERSNYWGHNAIIRTVAFAQCCGLPQLPGPAPFGGDVMSHDFVEAALLQRGGWKVLMAADIAGSYEETPPSVGDFLKRDARWCQGNMQHGVLLFAKDLSLTSRLHFFLGILSYVSGLLWLIFLVATALDTLPSEALHVTYDELGLPQIVGKQVLWFEASMLLIAVMTLLLGPKFIGLLPWRRLRAARFPGRPASRPIAGVFMEIVTTALLAPAMMFYHSLFVIQAFLGRKVGWEAQNRDAAAETLRSYVGRLWGFSAMGLAVAVLSFLYHPPFFAWGSPIWLGLIVHPALVWWLDSEAAGQRLRRRGLWLQEIETRPPAVMKRLEEHLARIPAYDPRLLLEQTVADSRASADHRRLLQLSGIDLATLPAGEAQTVARKFVYVGADSLTEPEKRILLQNPAVLEQLHITYWKERLVEQMRKAQPQTVDEQA